MRTIRVAALQGTAFLCHRGEPSTVPSPSSRRPPTKGPGAELHLAPTWDNSEAWVPTMRHIAREGRVFSVGVNHCLRASDLPEDLPGRHDRWGGDDDWLARGNTVIAGPDGSLRGGPLVGEAGMVSAVLDLDELAVARMAFDPVGHYSRADVLRLEVDRTPHRPLRVHDAVERGGDDAGGPPPPGAEGPVPSPSGAADTIHGHAYGPGGSTDR